jgi:CheY-like chemotaxis protein
MGRILVLDDSADATVLIKEILGRKGHHVEGFTDEEQAIAHAVPGRWISSYWISNSRR